jgi:hypothetical protein
MAALHRRGAFSANKRGARGVGSRIRGGGGQHKKALAMIRFFFFVLFDAFQMEKLSGLVFGVLVDKGFFALKANETCFVIRLLFHFHTRVAEFFIADETKAIVSRFRRHTGSRTEYSIVMRRIVSLQHFTARPARQTIL